MIRYIPKIIDFHGYDPAPEPEVLSKRIVYARRGLGLTQDDLARAIRVDLVLIWHWEKGHVEPPETRIQQLNQLLKTKQILVRL